MKLNKKVTKTSIKETLIRIGAVSEKNLEVFSNGTRDREDLVVLRDFKTGVIFIDGFYVGDSEYASGKYKNSPKPLLENNSNLELFNDTKRRTNSYKQFFIGQKVIDFGCGTGSFLKEIKDQASSVVGVELDASYRDNLIALGIPCFEHIDEKNNNFDTAFLFHVLEHLPDPIFYLGQIKKILKQSGKGTIIVEVPHANDFLLKHMKIEAFKKFTLWSQHLVLHTRYSLESLLSEVGFSNIIIEGRQRYSLSNHFQWMVNGKPSGHKSVLSIVESHDLSESYANSLSRIDANDTLVAIAST